MNLTSILYFRFLSLLFAGIFQVLDITLINCKWLSYWILFYVIMQRYHVGFLKRIYNYTP